MPLEPYSGYLDLRKYGSVPHSGEQGGGGRGQGRWDVAPIQWGHAAGRCGAGVCQLAHRPALALSPAPAPLHTPSAGFGLGFERLILFATGLDNIREVIPFPRWPGNAAY